MREGGAEKESQNKKGREMFLCDKKGRRLEGN